MCLLEKLDSVFPSQPRQIHDPAQMKHGKWVRNLENYVVALKPEPIWVYEFKICKLNFQFLNDFLVSLN